LQVFDLFGSHNIAIDGFDLGIKANPLSKWQKGKRHIPLRVVIAFFHFDKGRL